MYEPTETEYESSSETDSTVEKERAASACTKKKSDKKLSQWKLKNLSVNPDSIHFLMNDEQKQHLESIN